MKAVTFKPIYLECESISERPAHGSSSRRCKPSACSRLPPWGGPFPGLARGTRSLRGPLAFHRHTHWSLIGPGQSTWLGRANESLPCVFLLKRTMRKSAWPLPDARTWKYINLLGALREKTHVWRSPVSSGREKSKSERGEGKEGGKDPGSGWPRFHLFLPLPHGLPAAGLLKLALDSTGNTILLCPSFSESGFSHVQPR